MAAAMAAYNAMPDTSGTGAYPALKEEVAGLPAHTIYRPQDLAAAGDKLGVLGWGNGGCADDGASQRLHLAELASHGYVVVAPGAIKSGPGAPPQPAPEAPPPGPPRLIANTTAEQVMQGIEWVLAENAREGSPYYQRIDPAQVAVAGFSCGGLQAIQLAGDPRIHAVVVQNSGVFKDGTQGMENLVVTKDMLNAFHTPVLYLDGGPSDIAYENGMDDYERINHVPIAMINQDTGHGGTYLEPNGGANAQVVVRWLNWQLRGDTEAGSWFVGDDCLLCADDKWTVERKNFPATLD
ncbi:MAG: hypothetical protein H6978_06420 [Gammaproteobacteria bacterium]|nr:hypothetical protein [Gammaproteobacteria bacterium]